VKFSITISFLSWRQEFYWGKVDANISLLELSGTILTIGIDIALKVG